MKKRLFSAALAVTMLAALFSSGISKNDTVKAAETATLSNPRIVPDNSMTSGQKVTWDCVWFGSYPQAEVVPSENDTALDERLRQEGDMIVSEETYTALQNASGWDAKNEIVWNGEKYRRMKKGDAAYTDSSSGYYKWADSTSYHYFKYESIKWRVLHTDGNQALLLSDIVLDDQPYHIEYEDVTWETSTIRSWLNGYGAGSNQQSVDYSSIGKNFIDSAFSASEERAIVNSYVENADNISYGTEGGNNTTDKIFLLSESEIYNTEKASSYGFVKDREIYDEGRRCKSSTYAKAMGAWSNTDTAYAGNCHWWLGSPGCDESYAMDVDHDGWVDYIGGSVRNIDDGVRMALNLNLSSSNLYTYAGTLSSSNFNTHAGTTGKTQRQIGNLVYQVTKFNGTTGEVKVLSMKKKKAKKVIIPQQVFFDGVKWNVTEIDAKAFYKCKSLTKVTIPAKVGKIGKKAFFGCKKLKNITIKTKKLMKKNVGKKAFTGIHKKAVIKAPKKKLKAYKKLLKARGVGKQVKIKK